MESMAAYAPHKIKPIITPCSVTKLPYVPFGAILIVLLIFLFDFMCIKIPENTPSIFDVFLSFLYAVHL